MALPEGSEDRLRPVPGTLLVERDEMAETYGQFIIVPASFRNRARKVTATVFASGSSGYEEGDRVLLAAGSGRAIMVGHKRLYAVHPESVVAKLYDADIEEAKRAPMAPVRTPSAARMVEEGRSEMQPEKRDERV